MSRSMTASEAPDLLAYINEGDKWLSHFYLSDTTKPDYNALAELLNYLDAPQTAGGKPESADSKTEASE